MFPSYQQVSIPYIFMMWPIYTFPFVHFSYSFIIFFLNTFCFWKFILHGLRKWCFHVAIATLLHFSVVLKKSLRSYIFLLYFIICKHQLCDSRLYFLLDVKKRVNNTYTLIFFCWKKNYSTCN